MTEKEYILELLYHAFLDIRVASYSRDSHTCFVLADVFHNVPPQMNLADKGEMSYANIVDSIRQKCEARGCTSWLDNATADITKMDSAHSGNRKVTDTPMSEATDESGIGQESSN